VTPAHDPLDYDIGKRHDLHIISIFAEDGRLNETAPDSLRGMDRLEARCEVFKMLQKRGLAGEKTPHTLSVGHCYRCGDVIEPYLISQWFVSMGPLSELAVEANY